MESLFDAADPWPRFQPYGVNLIHAPFFLLCVRGACAFVCPIITHVRP